jgi:hypothetical protein
VCFGFGAGFETRKPRKLKSHEFGYWLASSAIFSRLYVGIKGILTLWVRTQMHGIKQISRKKAKNPSNPRNPRPIPPNFGIIEHSHEVKQIPYPIV